MIKKCLSLTNDYQISKIMSQVELKRVTCLWFSVLPKKNCWQYFVIIYLL